MDRIDFYALPRAAQERFIGSVTGLGLPEPSLRSCNKPLEPWAWVGASVASFVLVFLLGRAGYGDLSSGLAIQKLGWLLVYVALVGLLVFGALRALALFHEHRGSPFPRGIYLFPVGVIDARRSVFHLYPIEELAHVTGPDANGLTLHFGGRSFAFPVTDEEMAQNASREIASARGTVAQARGSRESIRPKALAAVDPLQGSTNPLGPSERMARQTPLWARFAIPIAIGTGLAVGGSVWVARNAKSDDALYTQAIAAGDTASFRAYLERASRHATEVSLVLLPRAELQDVEKTGKVEAIEAFAAEHPDTQIPSEIAGAIRRALLAELAAAVRAGTLSAIFDFTRRFPNAHLDAEVARARHGVYKAALDRYLAAAPAKAPSETAFVQALLTWAESHGAPVEIHFVRRKSKSIEKADSAVAKHTLFRGVASLPSRYFDGDGEKPYEDSLVSAITSRFSRVFPEEILAFRPGEPIVGPDAVLPDTVALPTLFIEHGTSWHGALIGSKNPRGVFCGLELSFDALFRLPDATKPLKVTFDAWRLPNLPAASGAEKPEETLYAEMHEKAFDLFQKRLLGAFFDPSK